MDAPEPSVFDPAEPGVEGEALRRGEADIAAGRVVAQGDVLRWLESWGTGGELPPPKCQG